ncbi:DUF1449 domain-containing protein [Photobacterium chitinilyticum]|uniref:DUF1449 domain-containing protein n=1 Tax=Photobacterium chitinilyticum TaxID=2485123 RepID=A0A444JUS9_9GAMM|nr:DUF1449 domain-containing protein [Photobacterium chitinilyticum]RWX56834.1 DUF1449 domain-containing protein [Photobacterium chitinilyticum]
MSAFINALLSYPVVVFSVPFCLFFGLMLIDLIFDLSDGSLGDADGVDLDSGWSAKLLLPPIVSQVPLPVALTVSSFVAMVLTYYLEQYLFSLLGGAAFYAVTVPALFVIYYLSLHISAFALKPLGPVFNAKNAYAKMSYEGMRASVRSNQISAEHGEVVIRQDGNEIQLDAYIEEEGDIQYGDEVVIVSKHPSLDKYLVAKI